MALEAELAKGDVLSDESSLSLRIEINWVFGMSRILAIAVILLLSSGCATSNRNQPKVDFSVEDLREKKALRLTLRNLFTEDICIGRAYWPNADGFIRTEGIVVSIAVADSRYAQITTSPYECFDFDNERICEHRIPPGGKLTAIVPYKNFRLPTAFWNSSKVLDYEPSYFPCDAEFIPLPDSDDPDVLFKDDQTGIEVYWNRPPNLTASGDVVDAERSCETEELVCIEFPFPLVIPKYLGARKQQEVATGQLNYYATSGPNAEADLCKVDHFRVVTRLENSTQSYQFEFSRGNGLERVVILDQDKFGEPMVLDVYDRVSGRIYVHEDICE